MPAIKLFAGMARSYRCTAINSSLGSQFDRVTQPTPLIFPSTTPRSATLLQ